MQVDIHNSQTSYPIDSERLRRIVEASIAFEGQRCDEVSLNYVDKEEIGVLHAEHFDDPSPTDCISFPMDDADEEEYRVLGEVFVCPAVAAEYVAEHGGVVDQEVILYTIHGLLHLMGYDDIETDDRMEMRAAEERHMTHLKGLGLCA
ncbi:MAG: rRNA maturation RNase YbeY [Chlamydiia bacterium]|nr:rRNA maturation RNase YbeY [Chlamydiia bacterium]